MLTSRVSFCRFYLQNIFNKNFTDFLEAMLAKLTKDVTEAFDIFDHEKNKAVDVREIGTIVRSLGCCPSEGWFT